MRSDGCEMVRSLSDPSPCWIQPANTVALSFTFSKSPRIKGLIMTELGMYECCRNSDGIDDIQLTFLITMMGKAQEV